MTITKFDCACGNDDPKGAIFYEGSLGYEAIVCALCARYCDHIGANEADEWSEKFVSEELLTINSKVSNMVNDLKKFFSENSIVVEISTPITALLIARKHAKEFYLLAVSSNDMIAQSKVNWLEEWLKRWDQATI